MLPMVYNIHRNIRFCFVEILLLRKYCWSYCRNCRKLFRFVQRLHPLQGPAARDGPAARHDHNCKGPLQDFGLWGPAARDGPAARTRCKGWTRCKGCTLAAGLTCCKEPSQENLTTLHSLQGSDLLRVGPAGRLGAPKTVQKGIQSADENWLLKTDRVFFLMDARIDSQSDLN